MVFHVALCLDVPDIHARPNLVDPCLLGVVTSHWRKATLSTKQVKNQIFQHDAATLRKRQ